ncbi:GtrA family protein [Desulfosporosinus sp. PR]|uniref:GtrA family protein n=1 Tax=Candidatus Desulfosporosinus nitrosoreducens TaxID=3401928 RepID=UPI0027E79AB9|nr:GtrA family protein [Desulfosporosinus sp. PR]MDQ7097163.1 GtrA family protein [Desulfosporosinus sp. PR]
MVKLVKRHLEFFRFCVVGGINTGIDFGVFALLFAWGVPLLPAHTFSYCCGILNSFWLNRKWTFRKTAKGSSPAEAKPTNQPIRQMLQFTVLNLVTLIATYELLLWFHENWGWPMLVSRLCAIVVSLVINFAGSRLWVFRQPRLRSEMV